LHNQLLDVLEHLSVDQTKTLLAKAWGGWGLEFQGTRGTGAGCQWLQSKKYWNITGNFRQYRCKAYR